jgi:haloacid dehalogenase-like hydrolase
VTGIGVAQAADPMPSWVDGAAKKAILDFVLHTTSSGGAEFVPPDQRIATFDNDGTLWVEQPMCTRLAFALDRVKAMAPKHPEWKTEQPFNAVLEGDHKTFAAGGEAGLTKIIGVTHAGMTTDEFADTVHKWLATAQHPRFKRPDTECVYQPMREVLTYLRTNGFKTFIVSGGGVEYRRVLAAPPRKRIGHLHPTVRSMRSCGFICRRWKL